MAPIPNGSVAVLQYQIGGFHLEGLTGSSADGIIARVGQELIFDGLTIAHNDVGGSGISFPLTGEFSGIAQINNQSGQELEDSDLTAQFADAVSVAGGYVITSAVTLIQGGDSQNSATASHGNVTTTAVGELAKTASSSSGAHACGDPSWGFFDDPAQWLSCLTSKGLSTVGLLAIGLIIGIILIVGIERRPTPV
jgi:hypothetical protein